MATAFLIIGAIFGLYLRAALATNGLPDLAVPSTSGYLCDTIIFDTRFLKQEAEQAYIALTTQPIQKTFPALFEDIYLFNKHNEVLLAWPILFPSSPYKNGPTGDYRLIIDSDGEIIGLVTVITPKEKLQQQEFRKCSPLYSFHVRDDDKSRLYAKQLDMKFPFIGYSCDGVLLNANAFSHTLKLMEKPKPARKNKQDYMSKFSKYNGKEFSGENLNGFPLRNLDSRNNPNGPIKTHRIIFQRKEDNDILVKGVVSKDKVKTDDGEICPKLWDVSSLTGFTSGESSPISRKAALVNNDGTYTCAKIVLNISTILLQVPLSLSQAQKIKKPSDEKYPILQDNNLWLWPIRFPESFFISSRYLFAIGCDLNFEVVGLFFTRNANMKNPRFKQCTGT